MDRQEVIANMQKVIKKVENMLDQTKAYCLDSFLDNFRKIYNLSKSEGHFLDQEQIVLVHQIGIMLVMQMLIFELNLILENMKNYKGENLDDILDDEIVRVSYIRLLRLGNLIDFKDMQQE